MGSASIGTPVLWGGFGLFVLVMLVLDLGILHRRTAVVHTREALLWTGFWVALSLLFGAGVYWRFGSQRGLEFLSGYVIEKALSVDNLFVFLVIFSGFRVPDELQHRVLEWGILGALVLRALFIFLGVAILHRFAWVGYVFGALLIYKGVELLVQRGSEVHPTENPLFRIFQRFVPMVSTYRGGRFTVVEGGKRYATPLLLALVAIEAADIVFAVDSIPAVLAITTDPYIVFTSNIFAILGLRSLYFALAGTARQFHYLSVGLALVLVFVGLKMVLAAIYQPPILLSLGVIAALLASAIVASLLRPPPPATPKAAPEAGR
jgi:tellurite resistance protein TerC